jgi:hypothetical protein
MKKINPFNLWVNGKFVIARYLYLICNNDNLENEANFYWAFYNQIDNKIGNILTNGNIKMSGADYDNWTSNEYSFDWAAGVLGVTFDNTPELINEDKQNK